MRTRIRLVAVGIGDYTNARFSSLPTSAADVEALTAAFTDVFPTRLDTLQSATAINIRAQDFLGLLRLSLGQPGIDDALVVIYFSGHATGEEDTLTLHFSDSDERCNGVVTLPELEEILRRYSRPEVVVILDCCYAGLAGGITGVQQPLLPKRTTVLASALPFQTCQVGQRLSVFTESLIKALRELDQQGNAITGKTLFEAIRQDPDMAGHSMPAFFPREQTGDTVLKSSTRDEAIDHRFIRAFLHALGSSPPSDREGMWYALAGYQERLTLHAMMEYCSRSLHEPSWLGRRAMGSSLGAVQVLKRAKLDLIWYLVRSTQWMDVAVGIIAARRHVSDSQIRAMLVEKFTSASPMDVKWLALLYLADAGENEMLNTELLTRSGLVQTGWGLCEIWDQIGSHAFDTPSAAAEWLESLVRTAGDENAARLLVTHIALTAGEVHAQLPENMRKLAVEEVLTDGDLIRFQEASHRGMLQVPVSNKWLESKMFGSWRGQVDHTRLIFIEDMSRDRAKRFLENCQHLPSVATRMAGFQGLSLLGEASGGFIECVAWGFRDAHPWVQRAAIEWLVHCMGASADPIQQLHEVTHNSRDMGLYPGRLDLVMAAVRALRLCTATEDHIRELIQPSLGDLSTTEFNSLKWSLQTELIRI